MINKSSANLLASVPLRPLTLAIGLRRQWNSKVKKCQKYYIRGAEGGGAGGSASQMTDEQDKSEFEETHNTKNPQKFI